MYSVLQFMKTKDNITLKMTKDFLTEYQAKRYYSTCIYKAYAHKENNNCTINYYNVIYVHQQDDIKHYVKLKDIIPCLRFKRLQNITNSLHNLGIFDFEIMQFTF